MSIPYNALYTFQLAVSLGSLKQTANQLALTESAVSHQLKRLEKHLGQTLLVKQGRQLTPTDAGSQLAKQLSAPFQDIASALNSLELNQTTLTLFIQPSLLDTWLLPKVLSFRHSHAHIELSIKYLASAPDSLSDSHLLIKSYDQDYQTSLQLIPILDGETVPVCSPLFPHFEALQAPQDLLNSVLLHDNGSSHWREWFLQFDLQLRSMPELVFEDFHLLKSAALAAQGVALCPESLIKNELSSGQLVQLFDEKGNKGRKYGLEFAPTANSNLKLLVSYLRL